MLVVSIFLSSDDRIQSEDEHQLKSSNEENTTPTTGPVEEMNRKKPFSVSQTEMNIKNYK